MKQKTPRSTVKQGSRQAASPQPGVQRPATVNDYGFRWHAGRFRVALWMTVVAFAIVLTFGQQSGALAQWYLRDGYVATRANIVKAPYWADALAPKMDGNDAVAGWYIDLRVGEYPFMLPMALTDFDPDKNYQDQKIVPDANRFAVGSEHRVWFYADNKKKQPETVGLLNSTPALVISRTAFSRFPTLQDALEESTDLLIAPGILLSLAAFYLLLSLYGKRGGDTAGSTLVARLPAVFAACLVGGGAYLVNNEHPLVVHEEQYVPAEIEITRGPQPDDQLTYYAGYRVLWRTWQVQARLAGGASPEFTIDVDGLDPRRQPWASRHSPDFAAFQPGTKIPVWQSNFYSSTLNNLGSMKPVVNWDTFLSRERWPNKYTWRDFIKDNPIAAVVVATAGLLALIWLVPLGGKRGQ
jgi:hypothetical protein